jgi:hypothetical protein
MVPKHILLYHMTHVSNLANIVYQGGLHSYNSLKQNDIPYNTIAYQHIQDRRATKIVPCGPGGTLHDDVPFYFAARSPMLYTINQGNVPDHTEGQEPIIHLVTSLDQMTTRGT